MEHTPGPWSVGTPRTKGARNEWPEVPVHVGDFSNRGNCLALVYMGGDGATSTESGKVLANAHLIAASPDLYVAASEAVELLLGGYTTKEGYEYLFTDVRAALDILQAAIAKAKEGAA